MSQHEKSRRSLLIYRKIPKHFDFDLKNSNGPVKGIVTFAQDESGATTITGIFSKGFEDTNATYEYQIKDDCGNVLHDLTKELNVQLSDDCGTESFRHKFDNINLNCDNNGFLNVQTQGKVPLSKRNCKRDAGGNVVVTVVLDQAKKLYFDDEDIKIIEKKQSHWSSLHYFDRRKVFSLPYSLLNGHDTFNQALNGELQYEYTASF
ncbi:16526_t:CDS:2 [Funneliformis geosporum]|uniref:16526_t:CDS:1 n=1 Tax=Funneliformis geosporum TaxID=1117311 RepID=A0A9W4WWT8_9GLOM|nr:16526_t:CDS:2 [Funneliformis geosporum]